MIRTAVVALLLAGCAAQEPQRVVDEVKVPVKQYVRCTVPMPAEPLWATKLAQANADIWEQSKVLRTQVVQHEGYEEQLKLALGTCLADPTPALGTTTTTERATP